MRCIGGQFVQIRILMDFLDKQFHILINETQTNLQYHTHIAGLQYRHFNKERDRNMTYEIILMVSLGRIGVLTSVRMQFEK